MIRVYCLSHFGIITVHVSWYLSLLKTKWLFCIGIPILNACLTDKAFPLKTLTLPRTSVGSWLYNEQYKKGRVRGRAGRVQREQKGT